MCLLDLILTILSMLGLPISKKISMFWKLVPWLKNLSYEDRLARLDIPCWEQRRFRGDLIETYKIMMRREDLDPEIFFKYSMKGNLRDSSSMKLFKPRTKLKTRQNFVSQRVIDYWNYLEAMIVFQSPKL